MKILKPRKKYFIAHFVTDLYYFRDDEYEVFYAESENAVHEELHKKFGHNLLACTVRKATWAERREFKKANIGICIA
jgi:hypothetical protein